MTKNILVYLCHSNDGGYGYKCEHCDGTDPRENGDVIICEECVQATERGAEIEKVRESRT